MSSPETQSLTNLSIPLGEVSYDQADVLLRSVSFRMRTISKFTREYRLCEDVCTFLRDRIHKAQNGMIRHSE